MDSAQWRPFDPQRSWHLGVRIAAAVSAVLGVSLLLGGERDPLAWGLIAGSAALAGAAHLAVPKLLADERIGWRLQYAWSVVGVLAAGVFATVLDGGVFRYGLVLAVAAVAAGSLYRTVAHTLYRLLVLVVVVTSWVVRPEGVTFAQLVLYLGLFAALLHLVGELSGDLRRSLAAEYRARTTVDDRSRVLGMVGRAASLDAADVFDVVVDAVIACGFDIANIGVVRDGVRHAVATRGLEGAVPPSPAHLGIAGRAVREDRTVVVDDYPSDPDRLPHRGDVRGAVATPIRTDLGVQGALIGARTTAGAPSAEDVQLLELLALHAGHALAAASRYEDEQRVVARLRELDQLKRDFVSNVSHELRTPLTVVKGLGRTLATREDSLQPEQAQQLLDRVNANIRRLGSMLGGLLDFSRAGGDLRVEKRAVDVPTLVHEVVSRFAPMLERHHLELRLPDAALAEADPTLIEHVFENLLGNVAKHTPAGTAVTVEVEVGRDGVDVRVRDDGPGIPPEDIPRLTERYFRGTRREGGVDGSGVGLSLVNEILAVHQTVLHVRSSDAGTTFAFRLPGVQGTPV